MKLRKATKKDGIKLFEWRNDEEARNNFRNPAPVSFNDHLEWLERNVDPGNPDQVVIVAEDRRGLIGVIRLSHRDNYDGGEVAINVAPERRGEGNGKEMLRLLGERFKGHLVAEIKSTNLPSRRVFEKMGYLFISEHKGWMLYRRPRREDV